MNIWLNISSDDLDFIEDTIHSVMASLPELGFQVKHSRFPFSLHHEYYRNRFRASGRKLRHDEVAKLLNMWAQTRDNPIEYYVWQAIAGAVLQLNKKNKNPLSDSIMKGISLVSQGQDFDAWSKNLISSNLEFFR